MEHRSLQESMVQPISAQELENIRTSAAEMAAEYEVMREKARNEAGRQVATVSHEEWDDMHPILKGMYIQLGVNAYNRKIDSNKLDLAYL